MGVRVRPLLERWEVHCVGPLAWERESPSEEVPMPKSCRPFITATTAVAAVVDTKAISDTPHAKKMREEAGEDAKNTDALFGT